MSGKKTNATAMRRARQQLIEKRNEPRPPLPAEFVAWLETAYEPRGGKAENWDALKPFIIDALARSRARNRASMTVNVTHLVKLGDWLIAQAIPLDHSSIVRAHVDEYCRVGMPDASPGSRTDRRSKLRSLADQVNPHLAPVKPELGHRDALKPPYSPDEMISIQWASWVQPTPTLVRQMCLCVGLGAGAGIDSNDLKRLTGASVTDHGGTGIEITILGNNARTVWVLREYEDMVRRGVAGIGGATPLLGVKQDRNNVANYVYDRAALVGDVLKPEQSRLRTTWIATLMTRPVPMAVICQAAGLRSTRTLFDLLPFIGASDAANTAKALRDGVAR